MAMSLPAQYQEFDVRSEGLSIRWKKWHTRLERVFVGYEIADPARRKALLLTFAGSEFCDLVDTFPATKFQITAAETEAGMNEYTKLIDVVTKHFNPRTNLELQRFIFHDTLQKDQTILEYYAELDSIAETCEFHDKSQEIKSQIIRGCKSRELQKRGLNRGDLTLEQLLDFGRSLELTEQAHKHIHQATAQLDRVSLHGARGKPSRGAGKTTRGRPSCGNCGYQHAPNARCPAQGKQCDGCGKWNHFKHCCRSSPSTSKQDVNRGGQGHCGQGHRGGRGARRGGSRGRDRGRNNVHEIEHEEGDEEEENLYFDLDMIKSSSQNYEPPWRSTLEIGGTKTKIDFKLDSGADISVIPKTIFDEKFSNISLAPTNHKLRSAGQPLPCLGKFSTVVRNKERESEIEIFVVDTNTDCLLSRTLLIELDLVHRVDAVHVNPDPVFGSLDETPVDCKPVKVVLKENHNPYCPGKEMHVPDTLSRCPSPPESEIDEAAADQISDFVEQVTSSWPTSDKFIKKVREESSRDIRIMAAIEYTLKGWPAYKDNVDLEAREFFPVRADLSVVDGMLTFGERICIPSSLRGAVLQTIHKGHQGITKCRERAKTTVWWPGITKEIKDLVASCARCIQKQPAQRHEPLDPSEPPERPFQRVGTDLFEHSKQQYLVLVDYYSRYIEIARLASQTSKQVVEKLKTMFSRHGIPQTVVSDNSTQFSSQEFADFSDDWNFETENPSPRYPQSNGQAESAVKIAKNILDQEDPALALLVYRSTPLPNIGLSPAEMLFGRRLRTTLPCLDKTLNPRLIEPSAVNERDVAAKERQKFFHDRHHSARPLSPLRPGDTVLIRSDEGKKWREQPAKVISKVGPRSFLVSQNGRQLRRNRRHLLRRPATTRDASPSVRASPSSVRASPSSVRASPSSVRASTSSVRASTSSVRAPQTIAPSPTPRASPSVRAQSPARATTPLPASTPVRARVSASAPTPVRAMSASSPSSAPQSKDTQLSGDTGPPTPTMPPIGRPKRLTQAPAKMKDYVCD